MGNCFSEPVDFDREVTLFHFDLHRAIGKGAFGKVRVIEHKRSRTTYALKYIDKQTCIKRKAVANVIQERRLLEEIEHNFIVNLRYAFQDDENCFFVLDLMMGGDLRFHLVQKRCFPEHIVRFWLAELACGLSYLHQQHIMHRDIKPDNILLDAAGHAHLTDFNIAIHYSDRRLHSSVAGSMAYMAPEMLDPARRGYSWHVDWWSLGVVAYELLWHKRPFDGTSAEKTQRSIAYDPIQVPPPHPDATPLSPEGCGALLGLLDRNPRTRLGCRSLSTSLHEIQTHPWFAPIPWRKLAAKQLDPPYVPNTKRPNFDVAHELDEFMLAEKPLSHKKRNANASTEKMNPDMRQLEEQFTVYDFQASARRSYYPHNEPLLASHEAGAEPTLVLQSQTNTMVHPGAYSRAPSPSQHSSGSSDQSSTRYSPSHSRMSSRQYCSR
ncbi:kinase-like protein [Amylostereum chailletii]|nr:kinase-like protein [Amylostereum chailletii]